MRYRSLVMGMAAFGGLSACVAPPPAAVERPSPPPVAFTPAQDHVSVHVLDVQQGTCILVKCPDGGLIVDDCGSKGTMTDAFKKVATAILDRNPSDNGKYPAMAFVSHGDNDHYNWLQDWGKDQAPFVNRLDVAFYASEGGRYDTLKTLQAKLGDRWIDAAKDPSGKDVSGTLKAPLQCGGAHVIVLTQNTPQDKTSKATKTNAESIVLMVLYGKSAFISAGDAPDYVEKQAIANAGAAQIAPPETTVLMASHHGAETFGSNSAEWIKYVHPKVFLASAAQSTYGHPTCTVVDRVLANADQLAKATKHAVPCDKAAQREVEKALFSTQGSGSIEVDLNFDGTGKFVPSRGDAIQF